MKALLQEFESQNSEGDPKSSLTLHKIRLHHSLFSRLSTNGYKYIVVNAFIFKLQPGQFIYKEQSQAAPNLYFILYGAFQCKSQYTGSFGSIMCVGHTLGEESLFNQVETRIESVVAIEESCVLQLNLKTFLLMRMQRHVGAGGGNLSKDFQQLMYILESHFAQKNQWRV